MPSIKANFINIALISVILFTEIIQANVGPGRNKGNSQESPKKKNKVLLILMDGMPHDAVTRDYTGFNMMRENGVHSKGFRPCYPTHSFPNYYCIMTGLYTESNGFLANDVYDVHRNESFNLKCYGECKKDEDVRWWNQAEPLWVTASKQGKRVRFVRWCGCEVNHTNFVSTQKNCVPYTPDLPIDSLKNDYEQVLIDLADDKLDFAGIYTIDPDHTQHHTGLWSDAATEVIKNLATYLEHLQLKAESLTVYDGKTRLIDVLDIIVFSDHGHMNISAQDEVKVTTGPDEVVHMLQSGANLFIWPKEGKTESIYKYLKTLKNATAYLREELPERWHTKNNHLQAPLHLVADKGFHLSTFVEPDPIRIGKENQLISTHGFDNKYSEMLGSFMARGPHFKTNTQIGIIDNVQLYQIVCSILDIKPNHHNGTWSVVKDMLVNLESPSVDLSVSFQSVVVTVVSALAIVILLTILVCGLYYHRQRSRTKVYRTLPTIDNDVDTDELDL